MCKAYGSGLPFRICHALGGLELKTYRTHRLTGSPISLSVPTGPKCRILQQISTGSRRGLGFTAWSWRFRV